MRRLAAVHITGLAASALGIAVVAACTGSIGAAGGGPGGGGTGSTGSSGGTTGSPGTTVVVTESDGAVVTTVVPATGGTTGSGPVTQGATIESDGMVVAPDGGSVPFPTLTTLFSPAANPNSAGTMVLRHLTQFEYLNTVTALFGSSVITTAAVSAANVPAEPPVPNTSSGFPLPGLVDDTTATEYQADAEAIAKAILPTISSIMTCSASTATGTAATTANATCANTFITTFGQQMYRRPLTTAEVTTLTSLYQTGITTLGLTFTGAIDLLVEAMLQSPGFLYHWEIGPTPTVSNPAGLVTANTALTTPVQIQLDGYAMANRLSYFLWGTMPDATLFAAAAANSLSTADQITAQATRMLQDPKAQPAVANFFEQLTGMTALSAQPKDATTYPTWSPTLAAEMNSEFTTFVTDVIFNRTGELSELYTSPSSYIDGDLATLYKVTGVTGTTLQSTMLPAAQRAGFLTSAAWLTLNGDPASSNPVYRGHSIYTQLMCGVIPPPPPNVPPPAPASAGGTTASRFHEHDTQACAVACHSLMDPFGYPFENYDGLGQWRTTDNSLAVVSTSTVLLDGQNDNVTSAVEMVPLLAASPTVQECFTAQWLTYGLGRTVTSDDAPSAQSAQATFAASNFKVTSLLSALGSSLTFRYRTASVGEVLP